MCAGWTWERIEQPFATSSLPERSGRRGMGECLDGKQRRWRRLCGPPSTKVNNGRSLALPCYPLYTWFGRNIRMQCNRTFKDPVVGRISCLADMRPLASFSRFRGRLCKLDILLLLMKNGRTTRSRKKETVLHSTLHPTVHHLQDWSSRHLSPWERL
jgi:hypothetical protein